MNTEDLARIKAAADGSIELLVDGRLDEVATAALLRSLSIVVAALAEQKS